MPDNKPILGPVRNIPHNQPLNVPLTDYSNKYDANYRPEYVQEFNRADNQSGLRQLTNGLVSRSLSIAPKIGSGLGSIYGVGSAIANADVSKIWDNPIMDWMNGLDQSIKDMAPVYQSMDNAQSGLAGKMATTSF